MPRSRAFTAIRSFTTRCIELSTRRHGSRRRAAAGILGALMLFLMLFTVGTGYFMYVNQNNLLYTQALSARTNGVQSTLAENLYLSTTLSQGGDVAVAITNVGPSATTVEGIFVVDSSGGVHYITTAASPPLPLALDAGSTSAPIDTSIAYGTGTYDVKVLTQTGATFSATYPPTATSLAAQALSSGAIGDLYLSFNSYTYYVVATSGCPSGTGYSLYCLKTTNPGSGPGFAIPASITGGPYAFSITLTNLNPSQKDIVLDQMTLIYENSFGPNEKQTYVHWYIDSVGTKSGNFIPIMNQYSPITLKYNTATTVYFISSDCVQAAAGPDEGCSPYSVSPSPTYSQGNISPVFILSNGWELAPGSYTIGGLSYSGANYGQNSPFVSTLYY